MIECKKCKSTNIRIRKTKGNGTRYSCKECGYAILIQDLNMYHKSPKNIYVALKLYVDDMGYTHEMFSHASSTHDEAVRAIDSKNYILVGNRSEDINTLLSREGIEKDAYCIIEEELA